MCYWWCGLSRYFDCVVFLICVYEDEKLRRVSGQHTPPIMQWVVETYKNTCVYIFSIFYNFLLSIVYFSYMTVLILRE